MPQLQGATARGRLGSAFPLVFPACHAGQGFARSARLRPGRPCSGTGGLCLGVSAGARDRADRTTRHVAGAASRLGERAASRWTSRSTTREWIGYDGGTDAAIAAFTAEVAAENPAMPDAKRALETLLADENAPGSVNAAHCVHGASQPGESADLRMSRLQVRQDMQFAADALRRSF